MPGFPIYRDAQEKRDQEVRNAFIQFLAVLDHIEEWEDGVSRVTPSLVKELQRLAINQIYTCAGTFRDGPVQIAGVKHQPPPHTEVNIFVDEMCRYVNENWGKPPIHLAAYLMWRLNWIHPFFGGNGRTSRAISYLVLCARLGFRLPGEETIPDQIVANRDPYYAALRAADEAWDNGILDLAAMEALMAELLARQLMAIHDRATGEAPQGLNDTRGISG